MLTALKRRFAAWMLRSNCTEVWTQLHTDHIPNQNVRITIWDLEGPLERPLRDVFVHYWQDDNFFFSLLPGRYAIVTDSGSQEQQSFVQTFQFVRVPWEGSPGYGELEVTADRRGTLVA